MPLKFFVSALITFVVASIALGYFGFSASVSGIQNALFGTATTTEELLPAPETEFIPPADPTRENFTLPEFSIPKFPIAPNRPLPESEPEFSPTPVVLPPIFPSTPTPPLTEVPEETEDEYVGSARAFAEGALVNIVCSPLTSPLRKSISGTGVIIDSRGIILTVAHVGHYFLLENYPKQGSADCTIRTGSPARTAYDAELAYVSPSWVKENATALSLTSPRGNGEHDFALLVITKSLTSAKLPSSFTSVPLSSIDPEEGDAVALGGYGAEFLSGKEIQNALYPIIDDGSIENIFTFSRNDTDVLSVRGTETAQSGSSGGGIVNTSGRLVGLITTSSLGGGTAQRTLYAITPTHIKKSFNDDTNKNLEAYLRQDTDELIEAFASEIQTLAEVVWDAIQ